MYLEITNNKYTIYVTTNILTYVYLGSNPSFMHVLLNVTDKNFFFFWRLSVWENYLQCLFSWALLVNTSAINKVGVIFLLMNIINIFFDFVSSTMWEAFYVCSDFILIFKMQPGCFGSIQMWYCGKICYFFMRSAMKSIFSIFKRFLQLKSGCLDACGECWSCNQCIRF